MKEGEFKKRIDAVKWHHDFDMGGEGYSITEEDLTEMLAEAKKEFPLLQDVLPLNVKGPEQKMLWDLAKKRIEWFERWFGTK